MSWCADFACPGDDAPLSRCAEKALDLAMRTMILREHKRKLDVAGGLQHRPANLSTAHSWSCPRVSLRGVFIVHSRVCVRPLAAARAKAEAEEEELNRVRDKVAERNAFWAEMYEEAGASPGTQTQHTTLVCFV